MAQGLQSLLAFAGVLLLIPLALWLLKRSPLAGFGGAAAGAGAMRVVSVLPLGPNQRLLTVEVGQGEHRRWLVLAAGPSGISTLHTMLPQADAPAVPAGNAPPFAALLARMQRQPSTPPDAH